MHRRDVLKSDDGYSLRVTGKGGHVRWVPISDHIAAAILEHDGWAFPSPYGGHLTPGHVYVLIKRALGNNTPHDLRHRAATTALRKSRNLRAVQELLGHASVATTEVYTEVDAEEVRACIAELKAG